jgi:hypothetical protein
MLNALLVVSALLSQAPVELEDAKAAPVVVDDEPPKWEVFVGLTGGLRPDSVSGGGIGQLGINRRIFSWLRPELSVGLGLYEGPLDAVIAIRIGARLEWPSDWRLKPYVFLAFAHQHELGWEHAKRDPVGGILGLSSHGEHGVNHRSGLDSGLGLSFDFRRILGSFGGRLNVRASMVNLLGDGPPRYLDLMATFGVIF